MAKYKVLSTKKLLPSLVEQAKDIEIEEQEFISVKPIRTKEQQEEIIRLAEAGIQYAIFTSTHAVEPLVNYMHAGYTYYVIDWKVFCLSGRTKDAVLKARHLKKEIIADAENAGDLAKKIIEHNIKEVIFFCGNKRRDELPSILKKAGITIHEMIVYETVETPQLSTNDFDAVLFFSPSAVQSFFSINQLKKDTVCFAIGQTTANSLADFTDNKIIISEAPSQEMMLASVQFYFQNKQCFE